MPALKKSSVKRTTRFEKFSCTLKKKYVKILKVQMKYNHRQAHLNIWSNFQAQFEKFSLYFSLIFTIRSLNKKYNSSACMWGEDTFLP